MIICIVGPTGVGKSHLGMKVASLFNGEIINGDAFQIYKGMNIGTAKPSLEDRETIPHHLFDYVEPTFPFSIFEYQKALRGKIEELEARNILPVIVGGTGLYLKSSLYDFELREESKLDLSKYEELDNHELHKVLVDLDPLEADKIHENNRKRVLRAIEICLSTNSKKSDLIAKQEHKPLYDVIFIGLTKDRDELYELINKRVDQMFIEGLVDEVKDLISKYDPHLRAFQAIGYKEIISALEENRSLDEAKEEIKKNTRKYSKRQYTYFNHQLDVNWFNSQEEAINFIKEKLNS